MARNRKEILDYIGKNVDEATLTDQELQDRLLAYQELGGLKETERVFDTQALRARIVAELTPRIHGIGASDFGLDQAANYAANSLRDTGGFDPQKFSEIIVDRSPGTIDNRHFEDLKGRITNYLPNAQGMYSSFYKENPIVNDVSGDVSRLSQLTTSRKEKAVRDKDITDYLTALPGQLEGTREGYLSGETDRAVQDFEEVYAPRALESANARGMLFSGDSADLLTTGAFDVQDVIDKARIDLEAEDNQFYFNAAYQNKVRQALESSTNYKDAIANEQQNVLTTQQQKFTAKENDVSRSFQERMFQREQERSLALQQAQARRQRQAQDAASSSALYGQLGSTIGAIGGATVGGPAGSVVGSSLGQTIGTSIPKTTG